MTSVSSVDNLSVTTTNPPQRFAVRHPRRYMVWLMPTFLVVAVIWVPLTWWGGNIIDRSIGSAIFFFVFSFGWLALMGAVWARNAGAMTDPAKNVVELGDDGLTLTVASMKSYHMRFSDVVSA